jgi:putative RNase toxin 50 of polymorphic toxin system
LHFAFFHFLNGFADQPSKEEPYYNPEIYQGWVNVCLEHLLKDPENCSSFTVSSDGKLLLEFKHEENANAYFDPVLIQKGALFASLLPENPQERCDFKFCDKCVKPVIRNYVEQRIPLIDEDESEDGIIVFDDEEDPEIIFCHRCECFTDWKEISVDRTIADQYWRSCPNPTIENSYFDWYNQKYFHFFEQFLTYCEKNSECHCYWPQSSLPAYKINEKLYKKIKHLFDHYEFDGFLDQNPLVERWEELDHFQRGELTGYVIGKYGVDIFAGVGIAKAMKFCRGLRRANQLLTFETMALNERNKTLMIAEAAKRVEARKQILNSANLQIQWDKQGKHIIGHKNYDSALNKSILTHPDPQNLIEKFAGNGIKDNNAIPGIAGYKELVDFKEVIGFYIDEKGANRLATSWGKIHYAKDGVHIVPAKPLKQ